MSQPQTRFQTKQLTRIDHFESGRQNESASEKIPVKLIRIETEAKATGRAGSQPRTACQEGQDARNLASRVSVRDRFWSLDVRVINLLEPDVVARSQTEEEKEATSQPAQEATSLPASSDRETATARECSARGKAWRERELHPGQRQTAGGRLTSQPAWRPLPSQPAQLRTFDRELDPS